MTITEPTTADETQADLEAGATVEAPVEDVLAEDVLVEEISIDGMCGVY